MWYNEGSHFNCTTERMPIVTFYLTLWELRLFLPNSGAFIWKLPCKTVCRLYSKTFIKHTNCSDYFSLLLRILIRKLFNYLGIITLKKIKEEPEMTFFVRNTENFAYWSWNNKNMEKKLFSSSFFSHRTFSNVKIKLKLPDILYHFTICQEVWVLLIL